MGKLTSQEKKILRKQTKFSALLLKQEQIVTSPVPTRFLALNNCGLTCGGNYVDLLEAFQPYGSVETIALLPDKPYAFVALSTVEEAELAFKEVNGARLPFMTDCLYVVHVDHLPEFNNPYNSKFYPDGLILLENYLTEEEELEWLKIINWDLKCADASESQILKHRRVRHFGYEFDYKINNVHKDSPLNEEIPQQCLPVLERLVKAGHIKVLPDQLTVNHYLPGQGIPPHVDTHSAFEDSIICISLGFQIVMDFRHPSGIHVPILLPKNSVLIMSGESRYLWTHGITPRKTDLVSLKTGLQTVLTLSERKPRTSFTFRTVRKGECNCTYKEQCDSYKKNLKQSSTLSEKEAIQLEHLHVHQVYEDIASHFSDTRHKPWPKVENFLKEFMKGSLILDLGCGNGKYMGHNNLFEIGFDHSMKLAEICQDRKLEVLVADMLHVPFRTDIFDGCLCIAVLHHLATEERRITALEEIGRVLKPLGRGLIYVWAFEQESSTGPSNYLKQSRQRKKHEKLASETRTFTDTLQSDELHSVLPVHVNRTNFDNQDMLVPWHLKNGQEEERTFHRFYHVFEQGELENLLEKMTSLKVLDSYYDKGNWCVVVEKIKSD